MGGLVVAGAIRPNQGALFLRNNFGAMGTGNVRAALTNINYFFLFWVPIRIFNGFQNIFSKHTWCFWHDVIKNFKASRSLSNHAILPVNAFNCTVVSRAPVVISRVVPVIATCPVAFV
jgi:hypothetical protein